MLFLTLPAAVAGGALAAFAFGGSLSLGAVLGLVAVLGIAVRNGLALIKHYQRLANAPDDSPARWQRDSNSPDAGKTSPHRAGSRRRGDLCSRRRAARHLGRLRRS